MIVLVVGSLLSLSLCRYAARRASEPIPVAASGSDTIGAWVTAKEVVAKRLSSPSTAQFGDQRARDQVTYDAETDSYRVQGWVDHQNRFGAIVRSKWQMTVKSQGTRWEATGILVD